MTTKAQALAALYHGASPAQMKYLYLQHAMAAQQAAMYNGTHTATGASNTISTTSTTGVTWVTAPTGSTFTQTATAPTSLGNSVMNSLYSTQHLNAMDNALLRDTLRLMGDVAIADGEPCNITLPDGGVLEVDADGSYRINDKDAKVIYRANRVRDFNSFINASDKLEGFIAFCKIVGVRQGEMLDIPIKHFIAWLIIEAALADGEPKPRTSLVPDLRKIGHPRCRCGRFISRKVAARKITFCRPACLERELAA